MMWTDLLKKRLKSFWAKPGPLQYTRKGPKTNDVFLSDLFLNFVTCIFFFNFHSKLEPFKHFQKLFSVTENKSNSIL